MRGLTDQQKLTEFMRVLGPVAREPARVYFTGGVTIEPQLYRYPAVDPDSLRRALDEALRAS